MDLDDLLGGGNASEDMTDPLDDMLGSPAGGDPIMDVDDLLGGPPVAQRPVQSAAAPPSHYDPTSTPSSTLGMAAKAAQAKGLAAAAAVAMVKIPKSRRLPPRTVTAPFRVSPIKLNTVKDPPPAAKPYLTNTAYYVNAISLITNDGNFVKRGVLINDTNIYVMTEDAKVERTIPVYHVEAAFAQDIQVAKALGTKKEWTTHYVLHVREGPDLFFSVPLEKRPASEKNAAVEDGERSPTPPPPALVSGTLPHLPDVLVALLKSFDLDLPVSYLKEGEWIHQLVKWTVSDAILRHDSAETLAYRTELSLRLQSLIKADARLIVTRNQIESSGGSASAAKLIKEIEVIERKNRETNERVQQFTKTLTKAHAKQKELEEQIAAQEKRRAEIVDDRIKDRQSDAITKHALEYEVMKAAHKSEISRYQKINAFLSTRAENSKKVPSHVYNTPQLVKNRLQDLQTEWTALQRAIKLTAAQTQATNDALAEARKRLAGAKTSLAQVTAEVGQLEQTPDGEVLPEDFNRELAETFLPVRPVEITEEDIVPDSAVAAAATAISSSGNGSAKRGAAAMVLSDDDDISPPVRTATKAAPALALSDDDDLAPSKKPTVPATRGKKILLDDDDDL